MDTYRSIAVVTPPRWYRRPICWRKGHNYNEIPRKKQKTYYYNMFFTKYQTHMCARCGKSQYEVRHDWNEPGGIFDKIRESKTVVAKARKGTSSRGPG